MTCPITPAIGKLILGILIFSTISFSNTNAQSDFPTEEFVKRREKLFEKIGENNALIFGNQIANTPTKFRQSPDLYYFTGMEDPNAILFMVGKTKKSYIFLNDSVDFNPRWDGHGIWQDANFKQKYGIEGIIPFERFWINIYYFSKQDEVLYLPFSPSDQVDNARGEIYYRDNKLKNYPIDMGRSFWNSVLNNIKGEVPFAKLEDINTIIDQLRWVKSPYEIEQLKKAGKIGAEGVKEAIKDTKPGMYEYELEAVATYFFVKRGARGDAFAPIVASGHNTYTIHYNNNDRKITQDDIILMDYGCDYNYYTSDITRVWPASGKFTKKEEKMYLCLLEARDSIIAAMKPGVTINELKAISQRIYIKNGYGNKTLSWNNYIGHFVGISVHDVTPYDADQPLEAGVVFNVEPVLDDPDDKIHMRLEDTILITDKGAINLTADVPANLEEIYGLMKKKGLSGN